MAGITKSTSDNTYVFPGGRTLIVRKHFHDYVDIDGNVVAKRLVHRELVDVDDAFSEQEIHKFAVQLGWVKEE